MALSINSKGTVPLSNVTGATFTAKLQAAGSSSNYPEGTVFDCSMYKSESITATVTIRRAGLTFLFGEGDFVMSAANQNMFEIQAPNVTIIGVSRSARDSSSANGSTRFVMTSTTGGYHIATTPTASNGWATSDSVTIMNLDLVGVQSVYTAVGGVATYTTQGAGGIFLSEGNPNAANQNINNVLISGVLIEGARRHGVMLYGAIASKLQNVRVRNAGGHGFYITGSSTSVNLDTCYASGNHLAGFCIDETSYSTLNNCASDSNGLGYWMRSSKSVTMSSCGAEGCIVRSSIPNNLGIVVPAQAGNVTINDIGADNVNFIKGTSFLFTGGSNITGTSCYSKDPSNRAGQSTFVSKYSAHIHAEYETSKVNMDNFKIEGTSPLKYRYRLGDVSHITIDDFILDYDPTNPTESPDGSFAPVAQVLDQGTYNVFGDSAVSTSFGERTISIQDPLANLKISQLLVDSRMSIPTGTSHPSNAQAGELYINTGNNTLYFFDGSQWRSTCCASVPTPPDTIFPQGGLQTIINNGGGLIQSSYVHNNIVYFTLKSVGGTYPFYHIFWKYDMTSETVSPIPTGQISASYHSYSTLTYADETNSLYFAAFLAGAGLDGLGDSHYIYKYSLDTSSIDVIKSLEDFDETQAADKANYWAYSRFFVYNGYLNQLSTWGPPGASDNVTKWRSYDLVTLDDVDNDTLSDCPQYVEVLNRAQQRDTFSTSGNSNRQIFAANRSVSGQPYVFYGFNVTADSWSTHTYDAGPATSTEYAPMLICKAYDYEDEFIITNRLTGFAYFVSYIDYSINTTVYLAPGLLNVVETRVNGTVLLTYVSATLNPQTNLYDLSIACKDNTGVVVGGSLPLNISVTYAELISGQTIHSLYASATSDYIYDIVTNATIYKVAAPWVE